MTRLEFTRGREWQFDDKARIYPGASGNLPPRAPILLLSYLLLRVKFVPEMLVKVVKHLSRVGEVCIHYFPYNFFETRLTTFTTTQKIQPMFFFSLKSRTITCMSDSRLNLEFEKPWLSLLFDISSSDISFLFLFFFILRKTNCYFIFFPFSGISTFNEGKQTWKIYCSWLCCLQTLRFS